MYSTFSTSYSRPYNFSVVCAESCYSIVEVINKCIFFIKFNYCCHPWHFKKDNFLFVNAINTILLILLHIDNKHELLVSKFRVNEIGHCRIGHLAVYPTSQISKQAVKFFKFHEIL